MTTKPLKNVKIFDGKLVAREAAAWAKKSPRSKPRADT